MSAPEHERDGGEGGTRRSPRETPGGGNAEVEALAAEVKALRERVAELEVQLSRTQKQILSRDRVIDLVDSILSQEGR